MSLDPKTIREVARQTEVLRAPKQTVSSFGLTAVEYYLLSEPVYGELLPGSGDVPGESAGQGQRETVVRVGLITSERPQIVTPYYLLNLFRGFAHGEEFAQHLHKAYGPHAPGFMYSYRNDLKETSIVSDPLPVVAGRLSDQLDQRGEALAAVIRGVDHLWDVSLMKFIFELTVQSLGQNVADLGRMGLLGQERGLPKAVRARLDDMFAAVTGGELNPAELKAELDRWGVFAEYEDRFLDLFRR